MTTRLRERVDRLEDEKDDLRAETRQLRRQLASAQTLTRLQRDRAELWKHRALHRNGKQGRPLELVG